MRQDSKRKPKHKRRGDWELSSSSRKFSLFLGQNWPLYNFTPFALVQPSEAIQNNFCFNARPAESFHVLYQYSHLGPKVSNRLCSLESRFSAKDGFALPQGDLWRCLETFWLSHLEERLLLTSSGQRPRCSNVGQCSARPTPSTPPSTHRDPSTPKYMNAEVVEPCLSSKTCHHLCPFHGHLSFVLTLLPQRGTEILISSDQLGILGSTLDFTEWTLRIPSGLSAILCSCGQYVLNISEQRPYKLKRVYK